MECGGGKGEKPKDYVNGCRSRDNDNDFDREDV
jgi:hypothetical protein